jgi:hypothetical protein
MMKAVIADYVSKEYGGKFTRASAVSFIHKYGDGSGEADIEMLGKIDRIEVTTA